MEDHEDEGLMGGAGAAHVSSPAMNGASSTVLTGAASKNGLQLLYNLLAIAYHVLEETKHVNLKPPLQPSSKLFTIDAPAPASPPRSPGPPDSPQEDGGSASEANGGAAAATHGLHAAHPIVIPYSPEEIQDSFTKIATLKNQYIKMSNDLLAIVKQLEGNAEPGSLADKEHIEKLVERRNHLRREVYERNVVMKGLIDRLRHLQHSIRIMKGGSAYAPNIIMESV